MKLFGIKINESYLVALALLLVFSAFYAYKEYVLRYGDTEVVVAKIIDVGIKKRAGRGYRGKTGYMKFRYSIKGKEVTRFISSSEIRDHMECYRIGDCIEVLVSLENENFIKWNEAKGSFKCIEAP
ncbi:MAG: DUF3592 domain-containing protein [Alistipes sp.]|jgi:hypothetical protein|nr:DUF3592 domain-containing protein [Alistipes sp.]